jgi:hypothetical protein
MLSIYPIPLAPSPEGGTDAKISRSRAIWPATGLFLAFPSGLGLILRKHSNYYFLLLSLFQ